MFSDGYCLSSHWNLMPNDALPATSAHSENELEIQTDPSFVRSDRSTLVILITLLGWIVHF